MKSSSNININPLLENYAKKYKDSEYFSGIAVTVALPSDSIRGFYYGSRWHNGTSINSTVGSKNLFQIGSITKSFTAALVVKLAAQKKISLDDKIKEYLPQYPYWKDLTIRKLLNMSTGIPNYSDTPELNHMFTLSKVNNLTYTWKKDELIKYVYPNKFNPPLKSGYFYSNTGYLLVALILEKVTQQTFGRYLESEILKPFFDDCTVFYLNHSMKDRMLGYNYNQYDNPKLVSQDISDINLSWGGAAGGIVASPEAMTKWLQALFINQTFLTKKEQHEMQSSLISLKTGKSVTDVCKEDPRAFSLGIIKAYTENFGKIWYYEGQTLGFRAMYWYIPDNNIIVSALVNSATNSENDHLHELVQDIYEVVKPEFL